MCDVHYDVQCDVWWCCVELYDVCVWLLVLMYLVRRLLEKGTTWNHIPFKKRQSINNKNNNNNNQHIPPTPTYQRAHTYQPNTNSKTHFHATFSFVLLMCVVYNMFMYVYVYARCVVYGAQWRRLWCSDAINGNRLAISSRIPGTVPE